jgi:hypothetical protein
MDRAVTHPVKGFIEHKIHKRVGLCFQMGLHIFLKRSLNFPVVFMSIYCKLKNIFLFLSCPFGPEQLITVIAINFSLIS